MPHPIVEHIPSLRRYARALRGSRADADDLVQDTLERAYRKWHLWRRGSGVRPWLFAIMHGVFENQRKLARNRVQAVAPEELPELAVVGTQEKAVEVLDVAEAAKRLPDAQREALLLVALEELSYADAARILDVPVGTVMSRLAAARARLRELVSHPGAAAGEKLVTS
ncbi:MAG TPA: sigma-70 family RNA polymerase sigma factor [Anaeromyxobacter sp.]